MIRPADLRCRLPGIFGFMKPADLRCGLPDIFGFMQTAGFRMRPAGYFLFYEADGPGAANKKREEFQ